MHRRVGVIGSGIGGIAVAIRLAAKGYQVEVFEKNTVAGGKIAELHQNGFRFDMGPSLFTMPHAVDELFKMAGKNPTDYFRYRPLNASCKYFYEDATEITAFTNPTDFKEEISKKTAVSKSISGKYLETCSKIYNLTEKVFIHQSLHKWSNYFSRGYIKAYPGLLELDAFTTMHDRNKKTFEDERVVQLFDRYATYVGSNPYEAPATLNMIAHIEHNKGTFFPEKGMFGIVEALYKLAEELGVTFHFNAEVNKVDFDGGKKTVFANNRKYSFDFIVSNADVYFSNFRLFGLNSKKLRIKTEKLSSSALIFYWGINREFKELELHNILFAADYRAEFETIFKQRKIYHDPTVYIFISSKEVRSDAPNGKENWFVMINVPPNENTEWNEKTNIAREYIISKINRILKTRIQDYIIFESSLNPETIESRTSGYKGALYGINSNSRFAAFNRYPNFSRKLKGLYFVGGSVHPGGGIPMCLASAKIVANEF